MGNKTVVLGLFAVFALCSVATAQEQGQNPQQQMEGQQLDAQQDAGETAGQDPAIAAASGELEAAVTTTLTVQSHLLNAFQTANFLEGASCPAAFTMISGACHPGFSDRVIIINQFPNRSANTWRCGFRNNNNTQRSVFIYTLCGQ